MRILFAVFIAIALAISLPFAGGQGQGGNAAVPDQQGNGNYQQPTLYGQMGEAGNGTGQGRAEAQSGQETGSGAAVQQEQQARNGGDEQGLLIMQQEQARSQAMSLNLSIEEAEAKYAGEASRMPAQQAQVYQNQNRARVAVQALLGAENISGIGKNVSSIAREFNNSVQATVRSEEKIRGRNGFERFLFGGDEKAAGELEQQVSQNQQKIMQMQQLVLQCSGCGPEVQAMLQEQLMNMEQEQARLMQLAQGEKQDRGIFGWLWK